MEGKNLVTELDNISDTEEDENLVIELDDISDTEDPNLTKADNKKVAKPHKLKKRIQKNVAQNRGR